MEGHGSGSRANNCMGPQLGRYVKDSTPRLVCKHIQRGIAPLHQGSNNHSSLPVARASSC